ncbi:MAG: hypothetical protein ACK53L_30790, partial [Pirellulaceae bacterium]
ARKHRTIIGTDGRCQAKVARREIQNQRPAASLPDGKADHWGGCLRKTAKPCRARRKQQMRSIDQPSNTSRGGGSRLSQAGRSRYRWSNDTAFLALATLP